jgi:mRNA cleavage and polyadenylation factor CLP1 P-loop
MLSSSTGAGTGRNNNHTNKKRTRAVLLPSATAAAADESCYHCFGTADANNNRFAVVPVEGAGGGAVVVVTGADRDTPAVIALQGRGWIEAVGGDAAAAAETRGQGHKQQETLDQQQQQQQPSSFIDVHGYALRRRREEDEHVGNSNGNSSSSSRRVRFESAPWSSWITISLPPGASIRLSSDIPSPSSSPQQTMQQQQQEPTLTIHSAHEKQARPTVLPDSWRDAVDTIVRDWRNYRAHHLPAALSATTKPARNNGSATDARHSASFFQSAALPGDDTDDSNDGANGGDDDDVASSDGNRNKSTHQKPSPLFQVVVCGAKGVGKSTCLRYCLNRLLSSSSSGSSSSSDDENDAIGNNQVAVLDGDPGQPEYCVPGMLQLTLLTIAGGGSGGSPAALVPPHCNLLVASANPPQQATDGGYDGETATTTTRVLRRYYLGSDTSASDPIAYIRAVTSLLDVAAKELKDAPLLVNLTGWVQGLGYEVLSAILRRDDNSPQSPPASAHRDHQSSYHVLQISSSSTPSARKALDLSSCLEQTTATLHLCTSYNLQTTSAAPASPLTIRPTNAGNTNGSPNPQPLPVPGSSSVLANPPHSYYGPQEPQQVVEQEEKVVVDEDPNLSCRSLDSVSLPKDDDDDEDDAREERAPAPSLQPLAPRLRPIPSSMSAAQLRAIRYITYFLQDRTLWDRVLVGGQRGDWNDVNQEIGNRFAAAVPHVVSLDAVRVRFTSEDVHRDIHTPEAILDALNGSLVGLCCQINDDDADDDANATPTTLLPCVGLGLVRGVHREKRLVYVLTPVDPSSVNVLAIGSNFHLPLECYFRGVQAESFPHLAHCLPSDLLGAEPMYSRNTIGRQRLQQGGP